MDRHDVQMIARSEAKLLGHKLGPFEDSGYTGKRVAHCKKNPQHFVYLTWSPSTSWRASGSAIRKRCEEA